MSPLVAMALLVPAGLVAGFVNTLAGAGSVVTIPALLLLGLPADVANATNRVAVLAQSAGGVTGFAGAKLVGRDEALRVAAPAVLGAALGAYLATLVGARVLEPLLVASLLLVAALVLLAPNLVLVSPTESPRSLDARPAAMLALFAIGLYGGLLQAGVGLFLLAFLGAALRYDLVRGNAMKVVVVGAFTLVAVAVFVARGLVVWTPGLVLAASSFMGARIGARYALAYGQRGIRPVVVVAAVGGSVILLLR